MTSRRARPRCEQTAALACTACWSTGARSRHSPSRPAGCRKCSPGRAPSDPAEAWNGACAKLTSDCFKSLADLYWDWPRQIGRGAVEDMMTLEFVKDASNVVLVDPNGVGKSMYACTIDYQAVLTGRAALFTAAGQLLGELAALDSDLGLRRNLHHYATPDVLIIDEVGYLSYSTDRPTC